MNAQSSDGFTLEEEKDGVRVYLRSEANGDLSVRVETMAQARVGSLVAILDAPGEYSEWVHRCQSARILPGASPNQFTYVSVVDMPFPFSDREVVARVDQAYLVGGRWYRDIRATPDALPPTDGLVRLATYTARWEAEPVDAGRIRFRCTVRTDAGKGLPGWLRKDVMTGGPVKTVVNLRDRLEHGVGNGG